MYAGSLMLWWKVWRCWSWALNAPKQRRRAVASADSVRERQALEKYLDSMEKADEEQQAAIDPAAVQAALDKLKRHPEPEAGLMKAAGRTARPTNGQPAGQPAH